MENAEKSYFAGLICFLCGPKQGQNPCKHTAAYLKVSVNLCLASDLEDLERQKEEETSVLLTRRLNHCGWPCFTEHKGETLPVTTPEPCVIAGNPSRVHLAPQTECTVSKQAGGQKQPIILGSNSLVFQDRENLGLSTYYSYYYFTYYFCLGRRR